MKLPESPGARRRPQLAVIDLILCVLAAFTAGCALSGCSAGPRQAETEETRTESPELRSANVKIQRLGLDGVTAEIWNKDTPDPFTPAEYEAMAAYVAENIDNAVYIDNSRIERQEFPYIEDYIHILLTAESAGKLKGEAHELFETACTRMHDAVEAAYDDEDDMVTVDDMEYE